VSRQDSVVRLNNGSRCSGSRVDSELELGLLAVLGGETLEEESTETRTSTTTERVEDQETLERLAVVGDTTNSVHDIVDHLLANGVVTTSVVVGGILLTTDQKLGVEQVTVFASSDLIDRRGVEIDEQRSRNILSAVGLGKEGLERTRVTNIGSVGVRSTVGAETVLEKVELPSRVTELGTGLTQVEVKNLDNKKSASRAQMKPPQLRQLRTPSGTYPQRLSSRAKPEQQDAIGKQCRAARGVKVRDGT
jgi:hypothetical protein